MLNHRGRISNLKLTWKFRLAVAFSREVELGAGIRPAKFPRANTLTAPYPGQNPESSYYPYSKTRLDCMQNLYLEYEYPRL